MKGIKRIYVLFRFLVIIYKTDPKLMTGNFILRFLSASLPVISLWIGKIVIDSIIHNQSLIYILTFVIIEALVSIVLMLTHRFINTSNDFVNQAFSINVSAKIINHINEFSIEELEIADFYNLMSRAIDETDNASEVIEHILDDIELLISIIVCSVSILFFNIWIVIVFLLSLLPSAIGEYTFYLRFYKLRKSWTDSRREIDYLTWLSTTEANLKEIRTFQLSDYLVDKLTTKKHHYYMLEKELRKKQVTICASLNVISLISYYLGYAYVAYETIVGAITIGTMVYLISALRNINNQFSQMFSSLTWLSYKSMFINDFFIFMDKKPKAKNSDIVIEHKEIKNCITLMGVGFKYPKSDKWALRHVNITVPAGQKVAILGANGCGKTTLLKILTGLYQPTEGKILVDGVPLSEIKDCQKLFGIIFQDYIKYEFEGQENIGISNLERMDDKALIEDCAQKSGAADFIEKLPLKYHQVFSNRFKNGMQLSGGEWQKIAVARAMFSNRPVLILDEPTASMDILSEKRLFENLLSNYANEKKTIIVVSHRLSQLKDIDRIIVMEDGQIVEDGKHSELIENKKTYYKMYEAYINR